MLSCTLTIPHFLSFQRLIKYSLCLGWELITRNFSPDQSLVPGSSNYEMWAKSHISPVVFYKWSFIRMQTYPFVYMLSVAAFVLQGCNLVVATETPYTLSWKYLLSGPLQKTILNLCFSNLLVVHTFYYATHWVTETSIIFYPCVLTNSSAMLGCHQVTSSVTDQEDYVIGRTLY